MHEKMKRLFAISITLIITISSFAQDVEAPVNPEFVRWQQKQLNGEDACGDIPYYVAPYFQNEHNSTKDIQFDPVYDLRSEGFLTSVKDQAACGVCWTFTTMGSIESFLLKSGEGVYDFSEQNMRTCHGYILGDNLTCSGGTPKKAFAYLSRMDGPIDETVLPYDADENATCTEYRATEFCFNQFKIFPSDMSVVKQAVLDYGAIYTNMYYDGIYFNSSDNTYYYDGSESTDHAVLLCGWDDNKLTAGGTGAWIVRNSWDDDWGDNGYFYISYNDTKYLTSVAAFPGYSEILPGDTIYMYNELGWISNTGYSTETGYGLVKFVTGGENEITRLGTYVNTEGATISFEVYDDKLDNTLSNLLTTLGPFTVDYPGYHSFEIPTPFLLDEGEDFYVKVEYNTPGYTYPIPFEKFSDGYADPQIETGVCWVSSTGASWFAYGSDVLDRERDLTIRAYAHDVNISYITNNNEDDFKLYPQPAVNMVILEFNIAQKRTIEIFDIRGRLVLTTESSSNVLELSLNELKSGCYFVKVLGKSNVNTKRLIIN